MSAVHPNDGQFRWIKKDLSQGGDGFVNDAMRERCQGNLFNRLSPKQAQELRTRTSNPHIRRYVQLENYKKIREDLDKGGDGLSFLGEAVVEACGGDLFALLTPEQKVEILTDYGREDNVHIQNYAMFERVKEELDRGNDGLKALPAHDGVYEGNLFAFLTPAQCKGLIKKYPNNYHIRKYSEQGMYVDHLGERVLKKTVDKDGTGWKVGAVIASVCTVGLLYAGMRLLSNRGYHIGTNFMKTVHNGTVRGHTYEADTNKGRVATQLALSLGYDPERPDSVKGYFQQYAQPGQTYLITQGGRAIIKNTDGTFTHVTFAETSNKDTHGQPIVDTAEDKELTRLVKSWQKTHGNIPNESRSDRYVIDYRRRQIYTLDDAVDLNDQDKTNPCREQFTGKKIDLENRRAFWNTAMSLEPIKKEDDKDVTASHPILPVGDIPMPRPRARHVGPGPGPGAGPGVDASRSEKRRDSDASETSSSGSSSSDDEE